MRFILVPGIDGDAGTFAPLAAELQTKGHTVVAPYPPGCGPAEGTIMGQEQSWNRVTPLQDAERIAQMIEASAEPTIVFGHSAGGPKALAVAEHLKGNPNFVGLVMADTVMTESDIAFSRNLNEARNPYDLETAVQAFVTDKSLFTQAAFPLERCNREALRSRAELVVDAVSSGTLMERIKALGRPSIYLSSAATSPNTSALTQAEMRTMPFPQAPHSIWRGRGVLEDFANTIDQFARRSQGQEISTPDYTHVPRERAIDESARGYRAWLEYRRRTEPEALTSGETWILDEVSHEQLTNLIEYSIPSDVQSIPQWLVDDSRLARTHVDWADRQNPHDLAVERAQLMVHNGEMYALVIERKDSGHLALPRGFFNHPTHTPEMLAKVGNLPRNEVRHSGRQHPLRESAEQAADRETVEEASFAPHQTGPGFDAHVSLDCSYSLPPRTTRRLDPRGDIETHPSVRVFINRERTLPPVIAKGDASKAGWMKLTDLACYEGPVWTDTRGIVADSIAQIRSVVSTERSRPEFCQSSDLALVQDVLDASAGKHIERSLRDANETLTRDQTPGFNGDI